MATDFTNLPLVVPVPDGITVEHHIYANDLEFDLYRPVCSVAAPAVVFVSGFPDPGLAAVTGKPLKEWASYRGWCRLVAAAGMAAIAYANRTPADSLALVQHLRAHALDLGLDAARLGVWACSGNAPNGLATFAAERLACAALVYPYLIDVDGSTDVAAAAKQFHFAAPPLALDDIPRDRPLLVVRAGKDATPGLDAVLVRFVAAARAKGLALEVVEHTDGVHSFDLVDDSPRTREVIGEIVAFLARALGAVTTA